MKRLSQPVTDSDRVLGSLAAGIVIVEYGDYDCPHTRKAHANLKQLMAEAAAERALVFRVFPLRHIHENAEALARMMWAVPRDRFWEAHEALMALRRMSVPIAAETLTGLGFDVAELQRLGEAAAGDVQREVERGQADGVHSTPSFFTIHGGKDANEAARGRGREGFAVEAFARVGCAPTGQRAVRSDGASVRVA